MEKQQNIMLLWTRKDQSEFLTIDEILKQLKIKPSLFYASFSRKRPAPNQFPDVRERIKRQR
jgi:hypothetical protein